MKWYNIIKKWFSRKFVWKEYDKVYHQYLHTVIVLVCSLGFNRSILFSCIASISWGIAWEVKDMIKKDREGFSWMDIVANFAGMFVGVVLVIIIRWLN